MPNPQSRRQLVLGAHNWQRGRRRERLSPRVLGWLFGWMLRRRLGVGGWVLKTALKTSVVPSRFCKLTTLLIALVAWTHLREMQDDSVSREHLHNLSAYSLQIVTWDSSRTAWY